MAEANTNYTDEMVQTMVAVYTQAPTRSTVESLAEQLGKTTRSIIAKLSHEGVYQPQKATTKTGEPVVRKEQLVEDIEKALGVEFPSLVKATKGDLQTLLEALSD